MPGDARDPDAVKLFARPRQRADGGDLTAPGRRWRAMLHYHLVDHAILRHHWTNMDEVAPGVWRSNQPTHARFKALKAMGIRTVINLRGAGEARDDRVLPFTKLLSAAIVPFLVVAFIAQPDRLSTPRPCPRSCSRSRAWLCGGMCFPNRI